MLMSRNVELDQKIVSIYIYIYPQKTLYTLSSPLNKIMALANVSNIELFKFNSFELFKNYINIIDL